MIIGYYAGLLALLYIFLTIRIAKLRWKYKVGIGDGGEHQLMKAIRVHANFAEQVPFAVILIYMLEMQQVSVVLIHGLGGALFLARALHAYGLTKTSKASFGRSGGAMLTSLIMLVAAGFLIYAYMKANYIL